MHLYALDLIGTFAFAIYGTHKALTKHFDLFGIFATASLTALGGGAFRELLLNSQPRFLRDPTYAATVTLGIIITILLYQHFRRLNRYALIIDAIGLAAFAFIGAQRADQAGLGLVAMVMFAVLTAVGGGILSDLAIGRTPAVFQQNFYATPAIIIAIGYWLDRSQMHDPTDASILIAVGFLARLIGLRYRFKLWHPHAGPRPATERPRSLAMSGGLLARTLRGKTTPNP